MSKNALVIKNINHSYSSKQSIVNFNLTVQAGEIVCLLGPSGAGKTTLLNIVAGFEKPDSGEILVGGKIISGLDNIV